MQYVLLIKHYLTHLAEQSYDLDIDIDDNFAAQ
jgi:hypothetical protein